MANMTKKEFTQAIAEGNFGLWSNAAQNAIQTDQEALFVDHWREQWEDEGSRPNVEKTLGSKLLEALLHLIHEPIQDQITEQLEKTAILGKGNEYPSAVIDIFKARNLKLLEKGDTVMIMNTAMSGKEIEEGEAVLVDLLHYNDATEYWKVKFKNDGYVARRWVKPDYYPTVRDASKH